MTDEVQKVNRIYSDSEQILYKALYEQIVQNIKEKLLNQSTLNFAICGGRSVSDLFKLFAEGNTDIEWNRVNLYVVDERLVPIDDINSTYKLAYDLFIDGLLTKGLILKTNLFPYVYDSKKHDYGISDYAKSLIKNGGQYDIVLLSAGEDGHIGALYPNHHSVKDNSEYFISMNDSPKLPKSRMSSSRRLLARSEVVYLFVMGESKRQILHEILNEKMKEDVISCPARLIHSISKSYLITNLKED